MNLFSRSLTRDSNTMAESSGLDPRTGPRTFDSRGSCSGDPLSPGSTSLVCRDRVRVVYVCVKRAVRWGWVRNRGRTLFFNRSQKEVCLMFKTQSCDLIQPAGENHQKERVPTDALSGPLSAGTPHVVQHQPVLFIAVVTQRLVKCYSCLHVKAPHWVINNCSYYRNQHIEWIMWAYIRCLSKLFVCKSTQI